MHTLVCTPDLLAFIVSVCTSVVHICTFVHFCTKMSWGSHNLYSGRARWIGRDTAKHRCVRNRVCFCCFVSFDIFILLCKPTSLTQLCYTGCTLTDLILTGWMYLGLVVSFIFYCCMFVFIGLVHSLCVRFLCLFLCVHMRLQG